MLSNTTFLIQLLTMNYRCKNFHSEAYNSGGLNSSFRLVSTKQLHIIL
jgi:hypothetical protein